MSDYTFTDLALDYSVDEMDDLTSRKIEGEGIDGDRLARIVRARRGVARVGRASDPYHLASAAASRTLWGSTAGSRTRRMAAAGGTGGHGMIEARHDATRYGTGYGVERYEI